MSEMIAPAIQDYAERFTSDESEVLRRLREKTFAERGDKAMLSGFYQGRLLSMLSKMLRPRRILEIGTYMGYSAMCLAEGLSEDGRIVTIDVNEETNRIAREFWEKAGLTNRMQPILGDASEIIPMLDESFELVFIDADKANYANYFDSAFPKMPVGGVILADNVLWSGKAADESVVDLSTKALRDFSRKMQENAKVSNILLTVRDGLMIVRKEAD